MAREIIDRIVKRGKKPFVVGGSGLYIRALIDGLAPIPPSDSEVRADIEHRIDNNGMDYTIEELRKVDPEYAGKVGQRDRKRLVRAFEVWETTGKSISEWHREQKKQQWCKPLFFGLNRPRPELHELIARRVSTMIDSGWIDEVSTLGEKYRGLDNLPPTVTEALGYKDIIAFIKGEIDLDTARERIIISTRQFAKRQLTWFRADDRIEWMEESGVEACFKWAEWIVKGIENSQ